MSPSTGDSETMVLLLDADPTSLSYSWLNWSVFWVLTAMSVALYLICKHHRAKLSHFAKQLEEGILKIHFNRFGNIASSPPTASMADQIEWSCDDIAPDCKLPGDVLVSILTYLPVKSLLKFKAVSKPWCCFISSPRFFKLHLHRQSVLAPNNCLISLMGDSEIEDWECGILNLSHSCNSPADHDVLMLEFPVSDYIIIDSCNGLVCVGWYLTGSTEFMLWNPATKRHRFLDVPARDELDFRTLGICYVDATNDFKILVWNNSHLLSLVETPYLYVYSLSSDLWDNFDFYAPKTDIHFGRPTFMGRCMHWLAHTCPYGAMDCTCSSASEIVAFDVINGAVSWFHLPVNCGRNFRDEQQTLVIRGCLSIVNFTDTSGHHLDGFEVWVMEEYGVEGSWVKRFFIQEEYTQVKLHLTSWNYGEIAFNCTTEDMRGLVIYDTYSKKKRYVEFSSYRVLQFFNYVECLASVGTS